MDWQLVVKAQGGDHAAFAALAAASIGRLTAIARLTLRDNHLAQDAVQEALVEAWRNIRSLRDPDRFDAWLYRLLLRACLDQAHRERRQRVAEILLPELGGPSVASADRDIAVHDELERGLRDLTPAQRAVIVLAFYLDLPLAEVATVLDCPIGTVKSRLNRALAALRARLDAAARDRGPATEALHEY
jgi:RNA polymerase sigma-70 factor (ECF subfamily)